MTHAITPSGNINYPMNSADLNFSGAPAGDNADVRLPVGLTWTWESQVEIRDPCISTSMFLIAFGRFEKLDEYMMQFV